MQTHVQVRAKRYNPGINPVEDAIYVQPGAALRAIRNQKEMTLPQVEDAIGIHNSALSRVERCQQSMPFEKLEALLELYGIKLVPLLLEEAGLIHHDAPEKAPVEWTRLNAVLSFREVAQAPLYVCQVSFEQPEFELIYRGEVERGYKSEEQAKLAAFRFMRKVLKGMANQAI